MGTVCNLQKGKSGRGRSELNVDTVRQSILRSPRQSIRRLSSETGIHQSSVYCILRNDIHAFPYKIQTESQLIPQQKAETQNCDVAF